MKAVSYRDDDNRVDNRVDNSSKDDSDREEGKARIVGLEGAGLKMNDENREESYENPNETTEYTPEDAPNYVELDKKSETKLMTRFLNTVVDKSINQMMTPPQPSRIQSVIEDRVGNLVADVVERAFTGKVGEGGGAPAIGNKLGILGDILNTAWAHGLGESMGARMPETVQAIGSTIGQQKASELVDNFQDKYLKSNPVTGEQVVSENPGGMTPEEIDLEKQKDFVLTLKADNPADVTKYAKAFGLSLATARTILLVHQNDILNQRGVGIAGQPEMASEMFAGVPGVGGTPRATVQGLGGSENNDVKDIAAALGLILNKMNGMENKINNLSSKVVQLEGGAGVSDKMDDKWNEDVVPFNPSEIARFPRDVAGGNVVGPSGVDSGVDSPTMDNKWKDSEPFFGTIGKVDPENKVDMAFGENNSVVPVPVSAPEIENEIPIGEAVEETPINAEETPTEYQIKEKIGNKKDGLQENVLEPKKKYVIKEDNKS